MPCCSAVLSAAAAASRTPPWLHRLHAKGGLSFPSNLHIDDLLYGQRRGLPPPPRPPPSSSNPKEPPPPAKPKQPKPKQQQQPPPPQKPLQLTNASLPNPSSSGNPPPPQLQLSAIVADIFVTPSSAPPAIPPIKAFRKQNRPRPRPDKSSRPRKENKDKAKVKKRCRSERAADTDRERCTRTEVTVIDTSTDGWKAAKLLLRRGATSAVSEPEDPTKVKRRAGLVSKIQRDREKQKQKEKEATSLGNIHATSSGDVMKESDGLIQALKRSICSEPEPEGQIVALLH
ncbi:hypothetical protein E2562_038733 [Oryza meyeriana var. granulata]|uniref:Uncharacterized protein n=2 Tax=Oryza meyeriana var. granulata TaxID=110450 RepID=A0A6G1CXT2_9ORYZ|nr:hypothetical protein E2562_038733 [Oryza meyeriana var. granulata]